ncbi:pentapeptide repeat-containing protein [uncultured Agrococcus sp.]|uniref:pentapeptide repeat-containing protein n=1 Tax=uncultured Agrococcus sp. TaxID=382258 RepID=UPI0025E7EF54|nr:pentapeptide repeat-containing protein [uncultured Agrococcus sp.]
MRDRKRDELQQPSLDRLLLDDLAETEEKLLFAQAHCEGVRFSGIETGDIGLAGATLLQCELIDWRVDETDLTGARFAETRIRGLNAPSFKARRTTWRDVEIEASRLGAAELFDSELNRVLVADSKLGWVNLRAANLTDVLFRNCHFDELDLGGAKVLRVAFRDVTADRLIMTGTQARHLDLRGLDLRAIEGLEGLRGATISEWQLASMAEMLAGEFGIRVEG